MESAPPKKPSFYINPKSTIQHISCSKAFAELELREKLYTYYFSRASWSGCKICYFQRSFESPGLFYLFYKIFLTETVLEVKQSLISSNFTPEEVQSILIYIGAFFQNCGNYLSFGDTKFVPQLQKDKFLAFIKSTKAYQLNPTVFDEVWNLVEFELYETQKPHYEIGMPEEGGLSGYYSPNIKREDLDLVNEFLKTQNIDILNTRVIKIDPLNFEVRIASVEASSKDFEYKGKNIKVQKGDFSPFLQDVVEFLSQGIPNCANETQKKMIEAYISHFKTGDMELHKESQKLWIQDKGPIIETNIGFIETYLDPTKVRAEWEGFVAIVDKKKSKILNDLVENAPKILELVPWPREFEVDVFKKPDFTSLEVLSFASSGTPIGINIPNYDDIRQNFGFKNVDLGNAYGELKADRVLFTEEKMKELYVKYHNESLFVLVAIHELLGHGTGKLFVKKEDGSFNFDYGNLVNPLTGKVITTYYDVKETWHSKFGDLSGAYEECKADAVAIFLATYPEILSILLPAYSNEQKEEILICVWYDVVYSGIRGLKEFSPETMKWGQAHMSGNYAILKVIMEADPNFVVLKENEAGDDMVIHFDHSKIQTVGKVAVGEFLKNLQINKSIGDPETGLKYFEEKASLSPAMLKYREIILKHELPRRIELMDDIELLENGKDRDVKYVDFEASFEGLISSHIYHYQGNCESVYDVWIKDAKKFKRIAENKN